MNKTILGRCENCDRIVWEDEGKVSQWYMSQLGRCRQCMEAQQERDMKELEGKDKEVAGSKQLWDAVGNSRISEVSKILHGDPRFKY
jgi:hypothetical protein